MYKFGLDFFSHRDGLISLESILKYDKMIQDYIIIRIIIMKLLVINQIVKQLVSDSHKVMNGLVRLISDAIISNYCV